MVTRGSCLGFGNVHCNNANLFTFIMVVICNLPLYSTNSQLNMQCDCSVMSLCHERITEFCSRVNNTQMVLIARILVTKSTKLIL